ncbi:ubiquitin-like modifier-activating enzyme ATG7 [Anastrepha ludens]|uniref:ubiquitin-like modifier-activating enzyme ATG7 n=1 Tax=Anastrepha ludens TaxID=28586 RepID=UPI0023AF2C56|nr:ubiquitin-like modifier-activating enzyme ATG7 [Anastrepha ludens]XP_053962688.1 ubiquitin-like modifier-activating enzyme ATG7 [Anastrepha ludens]XP_053962689.1 ubiquitin-like modifier-activating enzyme ATG7 [Anastrepha ludens]
MAYNTVLLQYAPLQSFVNHTFWHKLSEIKLNHDRLSDAPKPIYGYYTNFNAKACLLETDYSAFNGDFTAPRNYHPAVGTLYNKNTVEEFKACDKNELLQSEGKKIIEDFRTDRVLDDPKLFARFFVLSFADLAKYNYYYWFAFACPLTPTLKVENGSVAQPLADIPELQHLESLLKSKVNKPNFFVVKRYEKDTIYELKDIVANNVTLAEQNEDIYFAFADPSEYEYPSWLMRTFAAYIFYKCPSLVGKPVKFLGIRFDSKFGCEKSLVWTVQQSEAVNFNEDTQFVGWEPNRNNKMGPRIVSMRDSMDPTILVESAINLNLKLMKWRLVPDLDLDVISKTKCLLFGAGTLGCNVARNLLAWGFKHITFLDNGRVNFSNPLRQTLYTHADAIAGNVMKADIAAIRVKEINPTSVCTGHVMQIPMPGHTIGASMQQQTEEDLNNIKRLVQEHDVIFLLTDSRESRWLPTLLGTTFGKIVINSALGFDSYLVMRHGAGSLCNKAAGDAAQAIDIGDLKCISGDNLGCYFCNDVTAPGNSLKDRTLDQQCTVTRPGVSCIAASYAVELLVSLLQHPLRERAPAYYCTTGQPNTKVPEGLLGIIPHSIRGQLCNYENILPATQKFSQCIACSEKVLAEYRTNGNAFLFKAFETAKYLEDLTGISDFKTLDSAIIEFDDSDLEMSDSEDM